MNPKIKICTVTLVPNSALQALHTQCEYYDALQYENILTYEMIVKEEKMTLRDAVCNDETYAAYVEEYNKQKEVRRLP